MISTVFTAFRPRSGSGLLRGVPGSAAAVLVALLLSLTCTVLASETIPESDSLVAGIEKRYSARDFYARFHQASTLKAIDITEEASGRVYFSHPGKMRWEYQNPEEHQIITDGKTLWIYRPLDNQVVIGDAAAFFKAGAGGSFLSDISLIRRQFTISVDTLTDGHADLILVPVQPRQEIEKIRLKVTLPDHDITMITTFNAYGDTTEITFSDIAFGELEPGIFSFTIPDGVDILHMNP